MQTAGVIMGNDVRNVSPGFAVKRIPIDSNGWKKMYFVKKNLSLIDFNEFGEFYAVSFIFGKAKRVRFTHD